MRSPVWNTVAMRSSSVAPRVSSRSCGIPIDVAASATMSWRVTKSTQNGSSNAAGSVGLTPSGRSDSIRAWSSEMYSCAAICARTMLRRVSALRGLLIALLRSGERIIPAIVAAWPRVSSSSVVEKYRSAAFETP